MPGWIRVVVGLLGAYFAAKGAIALATKRLTTLRHSTSGIRRGPELRGAQAVGPSVSALCTGVALLLIAAFS